MNDGSDSHLFESRTMEGLLKGLHQNNGSLLEVYDEFSTLIDNLDEGSTGSSEKGRYLSLYSAVDWSKKNQDKWQVDGERPMCRNHIIYSVLLCC